MFDKELEVQSPVAGADADIGTTSGGSLAAGSIGGITAGVALVPGSIVISDGTNTFTDALGNGVLVGAPAGTGTVNYSTGAVTLASAATAAQCSSAHTTYNLRNKVENSIKPATMSVRAGGTPVSLYLAISQDGSAFVQHTSRVIPAHAFFSLGVVQGAIMDIRVNSRCRLIGSPVNPI